MAQSGQGPQSVKAQFRARDEDDDGRLTIEEYLRATEESGKRTVDVISESWIATAIEIVAGRV